MSGPLEIRTKIDLRWRDMDMLGHLNQAVYHEFLEEGRGALLVHLAQGTHTAHYTWVLRRVELDYRHEVRKDHGHVEVVVTIAKVGRTSLVLAHDVLLPDGTLAAQGQSVLVGWDAQARGARELSGAERDALLAAAGS